MEILIIALLILVNGIFSMSEIALVSSRKFKLEREAKRGSRNAQKALEMSENPNTFLSTVQIGITLIGILTGIFSGERITKDLKVTIEQIEFLQPYAHTIAVALVVVLLTYFSIVFGELIPKRIGLTFPEKIASTVALPMEIISKITKPFIWLLGQTNDLVLSILGIKGNRDHAVTEEEITSIIREGTVTGEIQEIEHDIVKRVFVLGDRKVRDLMTHRTELVWLDINDDISQVKEKTKDQIHSVYPVSQKGRDNLAGVINLKELLLNYDGNSTLKISEFLRKPVYVHEHLPVYALLEQLKQNSVHSAIVIDEYGAIDGMITMYDVLDALVGEQVPQSPTDQHIVQRDDHSWLADGQYSYFEMLNYFELEEEDDEHFVTLAGLILSLLNHIPVTGEKIQWRGFELEIVDMDDRKIDKVLITRKAD
jgi:putative hemolysin